MGSRKRESDLPEEHEQVLQHDLDRLGGGHGERGEGGGHGEDDVRDGAADHVVERQEGRDAPEDGGAQRVDGRHHRGHLDSSANASLSLKSDHFLHFRILRRLL